MPADSLTLAVTTGLGFSVLAGIVSGVCYILTYGLPHTRRKRLLTPWQCSICGRHFRSIDGVLEVDKVATCVQCGRKSCKEKCSTREPVGGWLCNKCKPDTWFTSLLNVLQPGTSRGWCSAKKMDHTTIDEIDEDLLALQKKEREQVRDFIERLVGALLGGDLDDVSVKKIYNDVKYLPISGQSPCSAHATLKLLIQKFIQEAADLPKLQKFEDHPAIPDDTKDRTYEDLLSTAIINKVIQNNQQGTPSRSISSRASSRKRGEKEYFFGERNLDPRRVHDDTSSLSSLDSDTVSLKIRGCIKEASSSGDETKDEDEVDVGRKKSMEWQDNWRLQKRKYDGTTSPVPVPMLVPDPITEAKVLIGDRDAEDTTDLSDAASDYEEALEPATLNSVLVNSRTVIGGRSPLESLVSKAESISEDGSTDTTDLVQEKEDIVKTINGLGDGDLITETSNDHLIEQKDIEDSSLVSIDSNTEKDLEYTERYASLPRTIYKCPKPAPRQSKLDIDHFDGLPSEHDHKTDNVDSGVTSDEDEKQKIFKGTYGEREKEKWNHAVPLSNNPYSKSNLERRLSSRSSNSSISSSFDRDYYIREAAKSAGARKGLTSSNSQEDEVKKSPEVEEKTIEPKLVRAEQITFKAIPAVIEDEPDSSIEPSTPTRPNHLDLSSDSDYSMERTYNIETGQVIRKPGSFRKEIMESSRSPEGLKYVAKDFDVDENQNKLILENEKRNFLRSLTRDDDIDGVDTNSSLLDSSFEEVRPPLVNHFKLVEEIANETSDQYDNTPLSPPAEYKSFKEKSDEQTLSSLSSDDVLIHFDEPGESKALKPASTKLTNTPEIITQEVPSNVTPEIKSLYNRDIITQEVPAKVTPEINTLDNREIITQKVTSSNVTPEIKTLDSREIITQKVTPSNVTPEIKELSSRKTAVLKSNRESVSTTTPEIKSMTNRDSRLLRMKSLDDKENNLSNTISEVKPLGIKTTPGIKAPSPTINPMPELKFKPTTPEIKSPSSIVNSVPELKFKSTKPEIKSPSSVINTIPELKFKSTKPEIKSPVTENTKESPDFKFEKLSEKTKNFKPASPASEVELTKPEIKSPSAIINTIPESKFKSTKPEIKSPVENSKETDFKFEKLSEKFKNFIPATPASEVELTKPEIESPSSIINTIPESKFKSTKPVTENTKETGSPTDFKFEKLSKKTQNFIPASEVELRPKSNEHAQPKSLDHESLNDGQVKFLKENLAAFKDKIETVMNAEDLKSADEISEDFSLTYSEVSEPEVEINNLKGKKLVNSLLGEFSKSFPNLSKIPARDPSPVPATDSGYRSASVDISEVDDDDDLPSVRRLSKIFDSNKNGKQEQVYSLTARSIPKEFRQELKKEPSSPTCEVIKEVVSSDAKDEEALPFPKAKSKIEFFEKLKH